MANTFSSNGKLIPFEYFVPNSGSTTPTVVVAYGTEALEQPFGKIIHDFCSALAANGFRVLLPDYFTATDTSPGIASVLESNGFDRWVEVLIDAVAFSQTLSNAAAGRTALVGFSLGGHLVLRAADDSNVNAVVDFFGPLELQSSVVSQALVPKLPPVLIHHGEADRVVQFNDSVTLDSWLIASSIPHEFHRYPTNGHPGQEQLIPPGWSSQAQDEATKRSIKFLTDVV